MTTEQYEGHVARQPGSVARLVGELDRVPTLDPGRPLVLTGIGTSLHAARVAATWVELLTRGRVRCAAVDAHDLAASGALVREDQVVVISHRGTKRAPGAVLERAAEVGARTVAVTGQGAAPAADVVLPTVPQERASTHTESYTAALVVLAQLVARYCGDDGAVLLRALDGLPGLMEATLQLPLADAVDAFATGGADPGVITGTGLDAITAAEAALKVKEGTYCWYEGMHTEVALHGTPAVFRPGMLACLIEPAGDDGGRTEDLAGLLERLGAVVVRCGTGPDAQLRFAPCHPLLRPFVVVLPFHRLVADLARRVGSSPDTTHLDTEPWRSAFGGISL